MFTVNTKLSHSEFFFLYLGLANTEIFAPYHLEMVAFFNSIFLL